MVARPLLVLAAGLLLVGACSEGDDGQGLEGLSTPAFAPATEPDGADDVHAGDEDGSGPSGPTTVGSDTPPPPSTREVEDTDGDVSDPTTPTVPPVERVSVDDPDDDAVGGLDEDPPAWADLAGVTLLRQGNAYGLRVALAGGDAPEQSDGTATMNIASFYDVDGDGGVDFEIWANLGPEGWGGSWFDDEGNAAFGEDSNVTVSTDGAEVVLLFPDVMLEVPDAFRFSVASEYGSFEVLGSSFARRDDVPDDDRAVNFP